MIVFAVWIVLATIILVVANSQYRKHAGAFRMIGSLAVFGVLGGILFLPAIMLQSLIMAVIVIFARSFKWKASSFCWAIILAPVFTLTLGLTMAMREQREQERLLRQYPFESMAERVPLPRTSGNTKFLPQATLDQLQSQEFFWGGRTSSVPVASPS